MHMMTIRNETWGTTSKEKGIILRYWSDFILENQDDCEFWVESVGSISGR